jgi:hypothetical protein
MASSNVRHKRVQLNPAQQIGRMRSKFPGLALSFRRGRLVWTGEWWPHALSNTYRIEVSYALGGRPRIAVLRPQLELAEGKTRLPHVYAGGQSDICVHRPEEWTPGSFIADTIMPWISQWLRFYEVWHQTGSWEGEGTHPEGESHQRIET